MPPNPASPQTHNIVAFGQVGNGGQVRTSLSLVAVAAGEDFVITRPVTVTVQVPYISVVYQFVVTIDKPMTVRRITLEGGRVVPETEVPQTPVVEAPVDETPAPPEDETPPPEPPAQDPPQTPVNNDPPDEGGNPPPDSTPPDEGGAQLPVSPPVNNDPPDEGGTPPQTPVNNDPPDEGGTPPEDNIPPDEGVTPPPVEPPPPPPPPQTPVSTPPIIIPPNGIHTERPTSQNRGGAVAAIKADAAHSAGHFGQGVTVAVLDAWFQWDDNLNWTEYARSVHNTWRSEVNLLPPGPDATGPYGWERAPCCTMASDTYEGEVFYRVQGELQRHAAHIIGAARNSVGIEGVAPSVQIMPLQMTSVHYRMKYLERGRNARFRDEFFTYDKGPALRASGGDEHHTHYVNTEPEWTPDYIPNAFRYAVSSGANIIHNSYQGHSYVRGYWRGRTVGFRAPIVPGGPFDNALETRMSAVSEILEGRDVVAVWDAGDEGWREGGYVQLTDVDVTRVSTGFIQESRLVTPGHLISNVVAVTVPKGNMAVQQPMSYIRQFDIHNDPPEWISVTVTAANAVTYYGWGPYYEPDLLGKWLVAVAVDQNNNNTIASFSNGCGEARAWCLAAPGVKVFTESENAPFPNYFREYGPPNGNGTPFAAAYVAGALALLRGRYPDMPMSVIAQILLTTATDLGAAGVDGVYGHGMLNVSAALAAQAGASFVSPDSAQGSFGASSSGSAIPGLPLERVKTQIPNALAGLGSELREVKMAVRYLNDRYYDAPLDVDIAPRPELSAMRVVDDLWNETSDGGKAGAARFFVRKNDGDQLREAGGELGGFQVRHNWFGDAPLWSDVESSSRPFFFSSSGGKKSEVSWRMGNAGFFASRGEEKTGDYNQYGVRLWKRAGRLHLSSALSEIREEDSLLGGRFGGVLPLRTGGETRQGKVLAKFAMDGFGAADEWHLFGSYQHARTEAKLGGVVSALSGLRARGWQAGLSGRGVFRGGDVFRFAIGEETALSGGKAILRYARSSGAEVDAATQIRVNRGIRIEEREVEIKNNPRPSLSAAYGFRPTEKSRLSFGITHTPGATSQAGINYRVDF